MKRIAVLPRVAFALASLGMLIPAPLLADGPASTGGSSAPVGDLALHQDGMLVGQVVTSTGQPLRAAAVSLSQQGHEIAQVRTNDQGYFAVRGVRGGMVTVQSGQVASTYRAWNSATAPPSAKPGVLLVDRGPIVRGQGSYEQSGFAPGCGCANCGAAEGCCSCGYHDGASQRLFGGGHGAALGFLTNPLVIGAIIATAIAVPIALNDDGSSS